MTPLEVTVKTLTAHRVRVVWHDGQKWLVCGGPHCPWESSAVDAMGLFAQHQAAMLAAAGVVMGVQEWGVRDEHGGEVNFYEHDSEAEARQAAEDINMMTGAEATVVTRFAGATEWAAEEGTK